MKRFKVKKEPKMMKMTNDQRALFTTDTADFQYHSETCHLQKHSDDTVIVGCVENGQEDEYRDLVESFVRWSRENLLQLNVTKTKEMVVDLSKSKSPPSPVCISGKEVELVPSYRFLGVQLDNKLEWSTNTDAEGHEQTLLPQETQVLQCLQQDAPHPACHG
ncbi:hypothetical protein D4764_0091880 [Takifugu flavidus]|uniref:Reverse transcriptase domain-containing protein n=1 Tax=Takifugu flavidus TaxID=433684 RepID=A0A5C6MII2_9TELE|nr:hypothetical protein D4764_0091880 [Takifugu flavidus]